MAFPHHTLLFAQSQSGFCFRTQSLLTYVPSCLDDINLETHLTAQLTPLVPFPLYLLVPYTNVHPLYHQRHQCSPWMLSFLNPLPQNFLEDLGFKMHVILHSSLCRKKIIFLNKWNNEFGTVENSDEVREDSFKDSDCEHEQKSPLLWWVSKNTVGFTENSSWLLTWFLEVWKQREEAAQSHHL